MPIRIPNGGPRLQRLLNRVLVVTVVLLAARVSTRYTIDYDWTAGSRNTLTAASRQQLAQLPDELRFLVFDYPAAETRQAVEAFVGRYRRAKPDVRLQFIDPGAEPIKARDYGVTQPGTAVIEYQGRHETLAQLSEPEVARVLQRLADARERYLLFLQGHGERGLDAPPGKSQYDLAQLRDALADKGLKPVSLNLVATPRIPDNAAALVIATPTQALLDGEIALIRAHVAAGGNLLWLADPDYPAGMLELQRLLGIRWLDGTVIFANYEALGARSPVEFFATDYPPNPVTAGFRKLTAYPLARALEFDTPATPKAEGWTYQPLVQTGQDAWLETGRLDGEVNFEPALGDRAGPLTLGLTLSRELPADAGRPARSQRVAVVGDGDFLSDLMLARHGNRQLATSLLQWIASRDAQLDIDVPRAPDLSLDLPPWAFWLYGAGFTAVIPLLLLGIGVARWTIRRRR